MSSASVCEYLAWDSEFFRLRIGRVAERLNTQTAVDVQKWCTSHTIDCLYLLCDFTDTEGRLTAERNDFHLVDVRVNLVCDLRQAARPTRTAVDIRPARPEDANALRALSRGTYRHSRFYQDGHFPAERCDALYETWIEKTCNSPTDGVLVATDATGPIGYVTCELSSDGLGRVALMAVDSRSRGKGLGLTLIQHALDWFESRGVTRILIATQGGNVTTARLFERSGFVMDSVQLWYHWWRRAA